MKTLLTELKKGDKFLIHDIEMFFDRWDGIHPVFTHFSGGHGITYVNKNWNTNTPLKHLTDGLKTEAKRD